LAAGDQTFRLGPRDSGRSWKWRMKVGGISADHFSGSSITSSGLMWLGRVIRAARVWVGEYEDREGKATSLRMRKYGRALGDKSGLFLRLDKGIHLLAGKEDPIRTLDSINRWKHPGVDAFGGIVGQGAFGNDQRFEAQKGQRQGASVVSAEVAGSHSSPYRRGGVDPANRLLAAIRCGFLLRQNVCAHPSSERRSWE